MWVGCRFSTEQKVHVCCGHHSARNSFFVRKITHNGRPLLTSCSPKGNGHEGGKSGGQWGGQDGVKDTDVQVTRTWSPSHQDAAKIWLSCFDPGDSAPAGGLRICPFPVYHQGITLCMRVQLLVFHYHYIFLLVLIATKLKGCKSLWSLPAFSRELIVIGVFFSPQSRIKMQPDWKLKMLFWPQNKSLWISFTQPVYLSCDSAEMGLWIWILSGSKALAEVAEPCPWQPCWINSFQMAGLKNEKKSVEYKLILIWCYLRHRFNF